MKTILTLISILVLSLTSFSQSFLDQVGFRTGFNISNIKLSDDSYVFLPAICPHFYFSTEKEIIEQVSIRAEFGYNESAFKTNPSFEGNIGMNQKKERLTLHFASFVVGAKIKPFDFGFKPYLFLGAQVNGLFGTSDYTDSFVYWENFELGNDYGVNPLLLAGLINLGIEFDSPIFVELQLNPHFSNLIAGGSQETARFFGYGLTLGARISLN